MYENNDFNQMLVFLIIYVLKKNTDCNHPMNAHEITKEINKLMEYEIANEKTVLRRLQTMYSFFYEKEFFKEKKTGEYSSENNLCEDEENKYIENMSLDVIGGTVMRNENNGKYTFYFEPILSPSYINFIIDTLSSNRDFRSELLKPIFQILKTLTTNDPHTNTTYLNEDFDIKEKSARIEADNFISNEHINLNKITDAITNAIKENKRICYRYGYYREQDKKEHTLGLYAPLETYEVNPYTLFVHNNHYYLLATTVNHPESIQHFRVDRMINVSVTNEPASPFPDRLRKYFNPESKNFDSKKYTSDYPCITDFSSNTIDTFYLDCRDDILQLMVDTFGKDNLRIMNSPLKVREIINTYEQTKKQSAKHKFYTIEIRNADYDNMREFCMHNACYVFPVDASDLTVNHFYEMNNAYYRNLEIIERFLNEKGEYANAFFFEDKNNDKFTS